MFIIASLLAQKLMSIAFKMRCPPRGTTARLPFQDARSAGKATCWPSSATSGSSGTADRRARAAGPRLATPAAPPAPRPRRAALREENAELHRKLDDMRAERDEYKQAANALARGSWLSGSVQAGPNARDRSALDAATRR